MQISGPSVLLLRRTVYVLLNVVLCMFLCAYLCVCGCVCLCFSLFLHVSLCVILCAVLLAHSLLDEVGLLCPFVGVLFFCRRQSVVYVGAFLLQAISNPKAENFQEKAWATVVPLVSQLKKYYEYSIALGMEGNIQFQKICSLMRYCLTGSAPH